MQIMRRSVAILMFSVLALSIANSQQSAPAASSQNAPPASGNASKAKALLDQAVQALGGQAYLDIKNLSQQGRTYSFHRGEATSAGVLFWRFVKFPDRERVELTKQRDIAYVYTGDRGFEVTFKGTAALEAKVLDDFLRRRDHSLELVLRSWVHEPGVALFYDGPAVAADKPAEQISVMNAKNDSVTIYLDATTHLPL